MSSALVSESDLDANPQVAYCIEASAVVIPV